ncbi:armadillo repeat-containing protein [Cavenderia fasciculata]|uniref:Armadillo repeat-containing protein n=1 Tax=Cavenderia fasciculata TaxID=261658 RepID=F4Q8P3_CACFS|nr:armadillo repeat-containing protein [Cavenderia fasciculata]EGG15062.1 armadillo repeat-containing protein [Cavenderia fasciculata]|eukprot:XP_004351782.1 armadillo repeat-containing protein [Cavenderia fasciculata]
MTEHYLDDLLREMMSEAEMSEQKKNAADQSSDPTTSSQQVNSQQQISPTLERRKSRVSHHEGIHSDFDYLETLLNDMSVGPDQSIRKSVIADQQNQNARVKSLRLTSQLDLESTLKDLEAFYKDNTLQTKRKQSSHIARGGAAGRLSSATSTTSTSNPPSPATTSVTSTTTNPSKIIDQSIYESPSLAASNVAPPVVAAVTLQVPPPPPPQPQQSTLTSSGQQSLSSSKRSSPDKVSALAREAIDAADLLDQMIESFGTDTIPIPTPVTTSSQPTPAVVKPTQPKQQDTTSTPVVVEQQQIKLPTGVSNITSGTGTIRPASKLGAPVDIAVSSPKAPTPISTLSSSTLSPPSSSSTQNSDKMLDEMISLFKDSNSNIKFANANNLGSSALNNAAEQSPVHVKPNYLAQQHYTMSPEDVHKIHIMQKQQQVDEDLVQKILCENDFEEMSINVNSPPMTSMTPSAMTDRVWYIKQEINTQESIGTGNHGQSSRAGIYKDKRIIGKSWSFIPPQSTPLLFNEIEQLISIKHPNILSLMGASITSTFNTFTEYITGNNLDIVLKNVDDRSELSFVIRIAEEIASAMSFLHSFNIVHRSLHPKNILLNSDLKVYIKDYGFANLKDETIRKRLMTTQRMTSLLHTQYMAPELFNVLSGGKGGYDTKVDVFSFGVLLWEMFGRDIKLSTLGHNVVNGYTYYSRPSLPNCPFTIDKLIRLCISSDPSLRPSFQTILKVLRQPLHTLQRFTKPESSSTSPIPKSSSDNNISGSAATVTVEMVPEKQEKINKIVQLVQDLISSPTLANLSRAAQTIEALSKNPDNFPYLLQVDFLPLIFELLGTRFEDVQLLILKSLTLFLENDELSELFRNLLGINTLIQFLNGQRSENILFASIRILQQLCHRDVNVLEVMAKGGIPILIQQLSHPNELVRLQIVWCLTMLLESSAIQEEFVKMGGVEILLDMFVNAQNDGFNLRIASALSKLLPLKYTQEIINDGPQRQMILEKYYSFLDSGFEALRMLGLEAIAILITNVENQDFLVKGEIVSFLLEYLEIENVTVAPQMTAIKIILVLSTSPKHSTYLKSQPIAQPIKSLKSLSPHPSIQKASEKIISLISKYLFNEIFKRVNVTVLELDVQFDYPSRNLVKTWHRNKVVKSYKQISKDLNWVIKNKYYVVLKEILVSMKQSRLEGAEESKGAGAGGGSTLLSVVKKEDGVVGGNGNIVDTEEDGDTIKFEASSLSLSLIDDPIIIGLLLDLFPQKFGELFFTINSPRVGGSRLTRFKTTKHYLQRIITVHGNIGIWNQTIHFIDNFKSFQPPSLPNSLDGCNNGGGSGSSGGDQTDYRLNLFETYLSRLWKHKERTIIKLINYCIRSNRKEILTNITDTVGVEKINQYLASDLWIKVMEDHEIDQLTINSEMIEFLHAKLSKYPFNRIFRDPVHALLLTNNVKLIIDNNICIENPNIPSSSSSPLSTILNAFHPSSSTSRKKKEQHFKDLGSFCPYIINSIIKSEPTTTTSTTSSYPAIQTVYECAIAILSKYKHILGSDPSTTIQNTIATLLPVSTTNASVESRSLFYRLCLAELYFILRDKISQHTIHMQLNSLIYKVKQLIVEALNNSTVFLDYSNNNNNGVGNVNQKIIIKYLLNRCGFASICEFGSLIIVQQSYIQLKLNQKNNINNNQNNNNNINNGLKIGNKKDNNNNNHTHNIIMIEDKMNWMNLLSKNIKVLQFIEDILKTDNQSVVQFDLISSRDAVSVAIQRDLFGVVEYLVSHFHNRYGFVVSVQAMSKILSQGYFDVARILAPNVSLHYSYDQKVNSIEMAKFFSIENKPLPVFYQNDDKRNLEFIQYLLDEYIKLFRGDQVDSITLSSPYGYFMALMRCAKKSQTISVIDYLCDFYEKVKERGGTGASSKEIISTTNNNH